MPGSPTFTGFRDQRLTTRPTLRITLEYRAVVETANDSFAGNRLLHFAFRYKNSMVQAGRVELPKMRSSVSRVCQFRHAWMNYKLWCG